MIVFGTFPCGTCHIDIRVGYNPIDSVTCPGCGKVLYEGKPAEPIDKRIPKKDRLFFRKRP